MAAKKKKKTTSKPPVAPAPAPEREFTDHAIDSVRLAEAERTERIFYCLALRIEDAVFQGNPDKRFHFPPVNGV